VYFTKAFLPGCVALQVDELIKYASHHAKGAARAPLAKHEVKRIAWPLGQAKSLELGHPLQAQIPAGFWPRRLEIRAAVFKEREAGSPLAARQSPDR
jgi:hypothetical protein